jgi:hypothetical protein
LPSAAHRAERAKKIARFRAGARTESDAYLF